MAATGVAAVAEDAVNRDRGNSEGCSRRHAGSHRFSDSQGQQLRELPWQRPESRR